MICPKCLRNSEVAYAPLSGSLICLAGDCTWERPLDEEEVFELFFRRRSRGPEAQGFRVHATEGAFAHEHQ